MRIKFFQDDPLPCRINKKILNYVDSPMIRNHLKQDFKRVMSQVQLSVNTSR